MTQLTSILFCGAGHSGSTLLGMVLGGAEGAFYAGEGAKTRFLHDLKKPLRKRACKICGENCPVWSDFHPDFSCPVHPQIAAHTGAQVIVDSSKSTAWITDRLKDAEERGDRACLIFLQRDGRAVVNSRVSKYPDRDPIAQINQWVDQMTAAQELFDGFSGLKTVVRYEDFATSPETVTRRLCDEFELTYSDTMLDFESREHHPLGGNTGTQFLASRSGEKKDGHIPDELTSPRRTYYRDHPGGIRLDLRWRDEFSAEHLALFQSIAGPINARLEWDPIS